MRDEVGALREALSALHTFVGLFSSVDSLVLNKVRALTESLPTLTALIWPFPRVNPLVLRKR